MTRVKRNGYNRTQLSKFQLEVEKALAYLKRVNRILVSFSLRDLISSLPMNNVYVRRHWYALSDLFAYQKHIASYDNTSYCLLHLLLLNNVVDAKKEPNTTSLYSNLHCTPRWRIHSLFIAVELYSWIL